MCTTCTKGTISILQRNLLKLINLHGNRIAQLNYSLHNHSQQKGKYTMFLKATDNIWHQTCTTYINATIQSLQITLLKKLTNLYITTAQQHHNLHNHIQQK